MRPLLLGISDNLPEITGFIESRNPLFRLK
jgi:hypothetical protein